MKRSLLSILVALIATFSVQMAQAQNYENLPQNAKNYIKKHFKDFTINHYEKDQDLLDVEHKVYIGNINSSYKLEFDKKGNIKKIESSDDKSALPNSVISVKMSQHVTGKFPNAKVMEWKKKKSTQVLELDNDIELIFNLNGDFLRIDD